MAQVKFRKKGQPSIKKSIPSGVYRKRWKVATIILGILNVLYSYLICTHIHSLFGR